MNNPEPYNAEQNNDERKDDESIKSDSGEIADFESCAKKYPVLETYPEQRKTLDEKHLRKRKRNNYQMV